MKAPIRILEEGTTVVFKSIYNKEEIELEGIVVLNNKDKCIYRNFRDLTYVIKSTDDSLYTAHHEDVHETVICSKCEEDLLYVGVDEKVWHTIKYNSVDRKTISSYERILDEDTLSCSLCGKELSEDAIIRIRRYLDI